MAEILEIVNGISQALSNKTNFEALEKNQKGSMYERSKNDSFNIKFTDNKMTLTYETEMPLQGVHDKNFETDIESRISKLITEIGQNYKTIKKQNLKTKPVGDLNIRVETPNRMRARVFAVQMYEIAKADSQDAMQKSFEDRQDRYSKHWLSIMRNK